MPEAVMYLFRGEILTVYFTHPKATLPVLLQNGGVQLLSWGRRQSQSGQLPFGGWAKLTSIKKGRWDAYRPRPVKLPLLKFMEKDFEGNTHWFDVIKGHWVQGLIAHEGDEQRLYVVTITPELADTRYDRWPRVMTR